MALQVTGSIDVSDSISGSMSGSFQGDGSKLTGIAGGTNPTTGSMPLNISGSFVDSPITVTVETVSLTLSEFDGFSISQEGSIINSGGTDSVIEVTFNVGQATGLVDGMTYASYSTSFGGNTDVFTLTWTYIAESNPDRAFGVGVSKLYAFGDGTTTSDRGTTMASAGLLIPPTAYSTSLTSETTVSSNLLVTGSINVSDSISGSMSGSFQGDGSKLTGIAGGTNPTIGSMPLNISGSFVDSPITVQPGGVSGGTQFDFDNNNFLEIIVGLNPGDQTNVDFLNQQTLGNIGDPVIFQVTTELDSGDGTVIPVGVYTGTITNPPLSSTNLSVIFSNDSGWTRGGSPISAPVSSAGILGVGSTLSIASVTTSVNLSVGGEISGGGSSTISLTPSEISLMQDSSGVVNSLGNITYLQFTVGQATNLVDDQTYSALTLGASTTYPINDPSTFTREWVYLASGNADLNLGLGNSILYTDNPNVIWNHLDDTGNRSINDYNSPAGLGQLDVATVVGSGGGLTTTSDITVKGNIIGENDLLLASTTVVTLPTANYSSVGNGPETNIILNGSGLTDVVYLSFNTGSGVGLVDGQSYKILTFDSQDFSSNWVYIDENNTNRAFPAGESRLYALERGFSYYDDNNNQQFTSLGFPTSYSAIASDGTANVGNIKSSGIISNTNASLSAKYYIEDSGATSVAGGFKFKIADNGDLGTDGYITFVRE